MTEEMVSRPKGTDGKAILGSDDKTSLNELEKNALKNLDIDKINDIAKCLFVLNNRKYGPIPGAYMVMCTKPGKEWCIGQLNADRAKPFVLFEDKDSSYLSALAFKGSLLGNLYKKLFLFSQSVILEIV